VVNLAANIGYGKLKEALQKRPGPDLGFQGGAIADKLAISLTSSRGGWLSRRITTPKRCLVLAIWVRFLQDMMAWTVGNEPFVAIDYQGGAVYAKH
jgi:hypothetical protein